MIGLDVDRERWMKSSFLISSRICTSPKAVWMLLWGNMPFSCGTAFVSKNRFCANGGWTFRERLLHIFLKYSWNVKISLACFHQWVYRAGSTRWFFLFVRFYRCVRVPFAVDLRKLQSVNRFFDWPTGWYLLGLFEAFGAGIVRCTRLDFAPLLPAKWF